MKNSIVMRAIAHEVSGLWRTISHPNNTPDKVKKLMRYYANDIIDLHDAYFELRGHTGIVWNISGMDTEAQNVKRTYNTIIEELKKED